jgi:hypothetical protein
MSKPKLPKFTVYVKRTYHFTAEIEAPSLDDAIAIAGQWDIEELTDAPGEILESEHEIYGVVKS